MMPCDLVAFTAVEGGALDDVHARAIVALHVEIAGNKVARAAVVEVARDRERLEKDLGHDHGTPEIERDSAVVERGERGGQATEVAVARVTDRGAVRGRMLMDDLRA